MTQQQTDTTLPDEQLEPDLEAFCRIALKLAKNGITHTEMTTDNDVVLAINIEVLGVAEFQEAARTNTKVEQS